MNARQKQARRVLAFLEEAGDRGTSWLDWAAAPPDGGPPVAHLAGVVRQLKDAGYLIESTHVVSDAGARYVRYRLGGFDRGVR